MFQHLFVTTADTIGIGHNSHYHIKLGVEHSSLLKIFTIQPITTELGRRWIFHYKLCMPPAKHQQVLRLFLLKTNVADETRI
jgi:hypothetical protein